MKNLPTVRANNILQNLESIEFVNAFYVIVDGLEESKTITAELVAKGYRIEDYGYTGDMYGDAKKLRASKYISERVINISVRSENRLMYSDVIKDLIDMELPFKCDTCLYFTVPVNSYNLIITFLENKNPSVIFNLDI